MIITNNLIAVVLGGLGLVVVVLAYFNGQQQLGNEFGFICGAIAFGAVALTTGMIVTNRESKWSRNIFAVLVFSCAMVFVAFPGQLMPPLRESINNHQVHNEMPRLLESIKQSDPALQEFDLSIEQGNYGAIVVEGNTKSRHELSTFRKRLLTQAPPIEQTRLFWNVRIVETGVYYRMVRDDELFIDPVISNEMIRQSEYDFQ